MELSELDKKRQSVERKKDELVRNGTENLDFDLSSHLASESLTAFITKYH